MMDDDLCLETCEDCGVDIFECECDEEGRLQKDINALETLADNGYEVAINEGKIMVRRIKHAKPIPPK